MLKVQALTNIMLATLAQLLFVLFFFFAVASSQSFAASSSAICEPVDKLSTDFPKEAFLTDGYTACFKPRDHSGKTASKSAWMLFFDVRFGDFSKNRNIAAVSLRPGGDSFSNRHLLTEAPPPPVSKVLLKGKLIPDEAYSGRESNIVANFERAFVNWQHLAEKTSHPAVAVSILDASVRVVINRDETPSETSLISYYDQLINSLIQSYLSLTHTEALHDIADFVTDSVAANAAGGLTASASGGDDGDGDGDGDGDPEPLVIELNGDVYPQQDSTNDLLSESRKNKQRLLRILRAKILLARAAGHSDMANILDNRIMLIEADLAYLNEQSTRQTNSDALPPDFLSLLQASLADNSQEVEHYDEYLLEVALEQQAITDNTDYQDIVIFSSKLKEEERPFYLQWLDTAPGLLYNELKNRLERLLRGGKDHHGSSKEQVRLLASDLQALVQQYQNDFKADLSSRHYGRQATNSIESQSPGESPPGAVGGTQAGAADNSVQNLNLLTLSSGEKNGGDKPPFNNRGMHTKDRNCPQCNNGPCRELLSEVTQQLKKVDRGALERYCLTLMKNNHELEKQKKNLQQDLGEVSTKYQALLSEPKKQSDFQKIYKLGQGQKHTVGTQTDDGYAGVASNDRISQAPVPQQENPAQDRRTNPIVVEEGGGAEAASGDYKLMGLHYSDSVWTAYQKLFFVIAEQLQQAERQKLLTWAEDMDIQEVTRDESHIILKKLDEKKIITPINLDPLKKFLEENVRYDLVHVIDGFLQGDYRYINKLLGKSYTPSADSAQQNSYGGASGHRSTDSRGSGITLNGFREALYQNRKQRFHEEVISRQVGRLNSTSVDNRGSLPSKLLTPLPNQGGQSGTSANSGSQNQSVLPATRLQTLRSQQRGQQAEGDWLCSHYQRRCYVNFECCEQFWPCHRCHNNQSTCGRKKLKSRDTEKVKCRNCLEVQNFGENCAKCGIKFAAYYCGRCKHLTGTDDHPYHCEKCGICRIHGDRSFHCDTCGVCLDVQLRDNHKCREGSAHDECCICLEDAFTGCQILPCSHKVHKECATQMIRSGITRCPICRESFAHKLERRPINRKNKEGSK